MAAPESLYTHKGVAQKTGETDRIVKFTSSSDSGAVNKSRFYLDGFVNTMQNGVRKWAGYCYVGSENYYMHNIARHGWMRGYKDGQQIVVFWDAGLNTLGDVSGRPNLVDSSIASFTVKGLFKSAYYIDSNVMIEYQEWNSLNQSWGAWFPVDNFKFLAQNNGFIDLPFTMQIEEASENILNNGLRFKMVNSNPEGIKESEVSVPLFPSGVPINFVSPSRTLYMNTLVLIPQTDLQEGRATRLFTDQGITNPYSHDGTNLYLEDGVNYKKWITYGMTIYGYNGVLTIDEWTRPPSVTSFSYKGFASTQIDAEMQVMNNSGTNVGTLYFNEVAGTAHKSYTVVGSNIVFGEKANQGYYAEGTPYPQAIISQVYYVNASGVYQEENPING
ncbi:hypothetical protein [Sphingobacterium psychroaquaticum]|uniref:Uncharacterized protein n=1 Tax=Sphingobacterium psychroaquaticum TaxID=561061 RepID=A0A1X7JVP2_9SPHI|nr:hypothetical protein [Sphingobacterium psychroaquaticum]SMG32479.1 hypothetical protein SAMN05660862_2253 [Sphingobacterium psychroaquaticum]